MSDLLAPDVVTHFVGVIDLCEGYAVHAIAGDRDRYQVVEFCGGDPTALTMHYRNLGVSNLYVADLDSIRDDVPQVQAIDELVRAAQSDHVLVDIGWTGEPGGRLRPVVTKLARAHAEIRWIAATESCRSLDALNELAGLVTPNRLMLGLDYHAGRFNGSPGDERVWIERAAELKFCGAVILDLASVGTAGGPTTAEFCRRVRERAPNFSIYSGGGIRTANDVRRLMESGCDRCLVATALHRLG